MPKIRTDLISLQAMREKAEDWKARNSALPKLIALVLLGFWLAFGTVCIIAVVGRSLGL